jgi:NOL1/NOP2/fmu family ribosome biogenesis protein
MLLEPALKQHLDPAQPVVALDLCGAPGGKATHLASLLPAGSLLISNEVIRGRNHILSENLQKWGYPGVVVTQNDPQDFQALASQVDLMVVDAPCSGEGLFRRDPQAVEEWSPGHLQLCLERQRRILMDAWDALRPGGLLVYSTCTFHPGENEQNLAWLSQQVAVQALPLDLPAAWRFWAVEEKGIVGYYSLPHRVKGEGFFLAVLRKEAGAEAPKPRKRKGSAWPRASQTLVRAAQPWLAEELQGDWVQTGEQLRWLPDGHWAVKQNLAEHLRWTHAGIEIAEIKKKNLKPAAGLALFPGLRREAFPTRSLGYAEALRYLRRENLTGYPAEGWNLVHFEGLPLGWVKAMRQRSNNYYPSYWKIRMPIPENPVPDFNLLARGGSLHAASAF